MVRFGYEQSLDLFIPSAGKLMSSALYQSRIMVSVLLTMLMLNLVGQLIVFAVDLPIAQLDSEQGHRTIGLLIVAAAGLVLMRRGWSASTVCHVISLLLLFWVTRAALYSGVHHESPMIHFFVVLPILQLLINGLRSGVLWMLICFGAHFGLYSFGLSQFAPDTTFEVAASTLFHSVVMVWVIAIIVLACFQYELIGERINQALRTERNDYAQAANHDALTGLLKRQSFEDAGKLALSEVKIAEQAAVLLFIDLDGFKQINDENGHHAGDAILVHVANALRENLRQGDLSARTGGDEFLVLMRGVDNSDAVAVRAKAILDAIQEPVLFEGKGLHVGASIGVARFPYDGGSIKVLAENADSAMYRAKDNGHSLFFSASFAGQYDLVESKEQGAA